MIKYLLDKSEARNITLLYSERTANLLAYTDVFEAARQKLGSKIVYTLSDQSQNVPKWALAGVITPEMIKTQIPDYQERLFYISGPPGMVHAMKKNLHNLGVKSKNIKTDFFPGYM
jgi:ferredoxin-NADP reductase